MLATAQRIAKALTAALTAGAAAYTAAVDGGVSGNEWLTVLIAAAVAGFAVWAVPNASAPAAVGNP
jgi:hypothetical protein